MADGPNSSNGANEEAESANKKSKAPDTAKVIESFAKDSFSKDESGFLNKVNKGKKSELIKDLKTYISNTTLFDGVDISSMSDEEIFSLIKKSTMKVAFSIINKRNNTYKVLDNLYQGINEKSIKKEIDKLSSSELEEIINHEQKREEFLIDAYGLNKKPTRVSLAKLLDDLKIKESDLSREQVQSIMEILESGRTVTRTGLEELFSEPAIFTAKQKKGILQIFTPSVSLQDLIKWNVLKVSEIDKYLDSEFKKHLKTFGVDESEYEQLIGTNLPIDPSEIYLSSFDFKDDKIEEIFSGSNLSNIADALNRLKNNIQKDSDAKIPSFDSFKEQLSRLGEGGLLLHGIDNLDKGYVLKTKFTDKEGIEHDHYIRIKDFNLKGEDSSKISIEHIGEDNRIVGTKDAYPRTISYADFLDELKTKFKAPEIISPDELKNRIKDKNNSLTLESYDTDFDIDEKYLVDNPDEAEKYKDKYFDSKRERIDEIDEEIKQVEDEEDSLEKKLKLDNLKYEKKSLEEDIAYVGAGNDPESLSQMANYDKLIENLNLTDPGGSHIGLKKGVILEVGDSEGINHVEIHDVDRYSQNITITDGKTIQSMSYEGFLTNFKKHKVKRYKKLDTLEQFAAEISGEKDDKLSGWGDYEVKSDKLVLKSDKAKSETETYKNNDFDADYLVANDSNLLLKIVSISGGNAVIQIGERKNVQSLSDEEAKKLKINKKAKGEDKNWDRKNNSDVLYIKGADKQNISLTQLKSYVEKNGLIPDWKIGKDLEEQPPKDQQNEFGSSFSSKIFSRLSVADLLAGGKMVIDSIEEQLKKGTEVNAGHFALAVGGLIPGEISEELKIKVEAHENEAMEKEVESLGKVDSNIATTRILKWLKDKNCPQHKKEAGLMFMLGKYGHLCAKELEEFAGQFFWYEAFGGRIGDQLYLEEKAKAEASNVPFSEETLMLFLLKRQCKKHGYNGIHRRSRLHKEFEGKWKNGLSEEFEKGYKDAESKRTAKDMVDAAYGEATKGNFINGLGFIKKAIQRGGSLEDMSSYFFTAMFSGTINFTDQAITTQYIKSLWDGEGMPIVMARFCSYQSDVNLFNQTVLDLSKDMEASGDSEYAGMHKKALEVFNSGKDRSGANSDRINKTRDFYNQYSTALSRALTFSNNKADKYSKFDKIIELNKDGRSSYSNYYSKVKAFVGESSGTVKSDFIEDACGEIGITGMNHYEMVKKFLKLKHGGGFNEPKAGDRVWEEISNSIKQTPLKNMGGKTDEENARLRKESLMIVFRQLIAGFVASSSDPRFLKLYNQPTSNIGEDLNSWGLNIDRDFKDSSDNIKNGSKDAAISRAIDRILSGSSLGASDVSAKIRESVETKLYSTENSSQEGRKINPDDYGINGEEANDDYYDQS